MWSFNIPIPGWRRCDFKADQFFVGDWKQQPCSTLPSNGRSAFYKVLLITSGKGLLVAGMRQYMLLTGDIVFLRPDEEIRWSPLSQQIEGYFCFVHPTFFKRADHVLEMFITFPHTFPEDAVVSLTKRQIEKIQHSFELMHQEVAGHFDDKKQAILLHLQMIMLSVRRAGKTNRGELNC